MRHRDYIVLIFLTAVGAVLTFGSLMIGDPLGIPFFFLATTAIFGLFNWKDMKDGKWNWWHFVFTLLVFVTLAAILFPVTTRSHH